MSGRYEITDRGERIDIKSPDGRLDYLDPSTDGRVYLDDIICGAIRQQARDIAELRAKTESSMSFKLWLEDMDENGDPIEWAIHGTSQDIGRMQARLGYLNDAVTEREQLRADLAAAVAARDWQIQATKAAIESCNQATTAGLAAVAERDQLRARLAASEAAPVVSTVCDDEGFAYLAALRVAAEIGKGMQGWLRLRSVSQILIQEIGAAGPENAEDSARRACGVIQRQADQIVSADTRIAELEATLKRQAAAVRMIDMSHVARAETMMQHAQVLHDQSNTAALESERQANALLTERVAELEQSVTVRDTEIARLQTDLELARRDAGRYRWLRDFDNEGPISAGNATAFGKYGFERVEWFYGDELDAAVDAARAGNGGEG